MESHIVGKTVLTKLPKREDERRFNPMIVSYDMLENGVDVFVQDIVSGAEFRNVEELPDYAIRPFIMNHIMKNCFLWDYPFTLVEFYNEEGNELISSDFYTCIEGPESADVEKERDLLAIATSGAVGGHGFTEELERKAENCGVLEGFKKIKGLFERE